MEYFGNCRDNDNWLAILGILLGDFSYSFGIVSPTTTEVELGYYHQKVIVLRASWDASRFQTRNRKKLGNFKKIYEILRITNKCPARHFWQSRKTIAKNQLLSVLQKKAISFNFEILSTIFCQKLRKIKDICYLHDPEKLFSNKSGGKRNFQEHLCLSEKLSPGGVI